MNVSANYFDPATPGTSNEAWLRFLNGKPSWLPPTDALVVVAPQPFDETFAAGGLIASFRRRHSSIKIVSVTDGEAAFPDWQGLREIRHGELMWALHRLCPGGITVVRLRLPDGRLHEHARGLRQHLLAHVPSNATLIAPYERDGHPGHDAVGRACQEVAALLGVPLVRYPIWAWHNSDIHALEGEDWGRFELSPDVQQAKRVAMSVFGSQLRPPSRQPVVPAHCLDYFLRPFEAFIL